MKLRLCLSLSLMLYIARDVLLSWPSTRRMEHMTVFFIC